MSSYVTVFVKFILPMAALAGFGLLAVHLVEKSAKSRGAAIKRPWPVSVLVLLWGFAIGSTIFNAMKFVANALTGDLPHLETSLTEAWIWLGVALLMTAALAAAAYALFNLRRSAIRLYVLYVAASIGLRVITCAVGYPEAAWRGKSDVMELIVCAATLGYLYFLKSRAQLV